MVADGGGDADEQNSDDDGSSGQSQGEARGEEKEGAGGVDQAQAPPQSQKLPELLKPSREELARDFPNPPKAPYQTLPDPRTYTPEQLLAGEMDVSYGGQVLSVLSYCAGPYSGTPYTINCENYVSGVFLFFRFVRIKRLSRSLSRATCKRAVHSDTRGEVAESQT